MSDQLFGIHGDALAYRSQRMGVLASNIANSDTPNYKARDLSFNDALRTAVAKNVNQSYINLQATQQSMVKIQGLSLFNYLR